MRKDIIIRIRGLIVVFLKFSFYMAFKKGFI